VINTSLPGARTLRDGTSIYWWLELSLILFVALVAVLVAPGLTPDGAPGAALGNGVAIVDAERFLGIFHEAAVQGWFVGFEPILIAANWWYGIMHFAVTALVLIWLFRSRSDDYPLWRNTLGAASALTLIFQAFWPATPPRLLDGASGAPGFVDTLATLSTPWSFPGHGSGGVANQYAAMPSMHCVWALWVACVVVPRVQSPWLRAAAVVYPMVTVAAIVVTGNHFVLDALGGFAALGIGYAAARAVTRRGRQPVATDVDDRELARAA
jgi:hypothetical protein